MKNVKFNISVVKHNLFFEKNKPDFIFLFVFFRKHDIFRMVSEERPKR